MKVAVIVARVLVGLIFVFFGSNAFLHFLPTPPPSATPAGQFLDSLVASRYVLVIGGCQVLGGLLLLINRYVPLGLTILGPIVVNILSYHFLMSMFGFFPLASITTLLYLFLLYGYRQYFASLFVQKAVVDRS
jgi:putative oxidoreductase